jgi:hypothetical protein
MGDMIDKDVVLAIINDHVQVGSMVEAIAALTPQPAPTLADAVEFPRDLAVRMGATDVTYGKVVIHNLANREELVGFDLVSFELADIPAVIAALAALQTKEGA